jgi:hypothetical protein
MSAIGTYEVMNRRKFDECLNAARTVRQQTTGIWMFQRTKSSGLTEFQAKWKASVSKEVDFDYSGYALGQYLDAQRAINDRVLFDDASEVAEILANVFTAAFVFDKHVALPTLADNKLNDYCRDEFAEDAAAMAEAITAAHSFYERGLKEITPENLVVFVIS